MTRLRYHIVTGTHDRLPLITTDVEAVLYPALRAASAQFRGLALEVGGIENHVHLIVAVRPSIAISDFICRVKSQTSRIVRQRFGADTFRWQSGYSALSLNAHNYTDCRWYVRRQKHHHATDTLRPNLERIDGA
jgi:REP element-mobilizing transposase RayT